MALEDHRGTPVRIPVIPPRELHGFVRRRTTARLFSGPFVTNGFIDTPTGTHTQGENILTAEVAIRTVARAQGEHAVSMEGWTGHYRM